MNTPRIIAVALLILAGQLRLVQADPVRSGNELLLNLVRYDGAKRADLAKTRLNMIHSFRFLRIKEKSDPAPETGAITLKTVDPSSEGTVVFTVNTRLGLEIVQPLTTNDSVAVVGRVTKINFDKLPTLQLGQVQVQYKDKAGPKMGRELLNEVDSKAH